MISHQIVTLSIQPQADDAMSFPDLIMAHRGCEPTTLARHRDPATDVYSLRCTCGLELSLQNGGAAIQEIQMTAIDQMQRTLPTASYRCNRPGRVVVEC